MANDTLVTLKALLQPQSDERWSLSYRSIESAAKQEEIRQSLEHAKTRHNQFLALYHEAPESPIYQYALFGNITEWARLASLIQYESAQSATQELQNVLDQLEPLRSVVNDALYTQWRAFTVIITQTIKQQALTLPNLFYQPVNNATPALLIAYEIYEDATQEADITRRNAIPHAGFATGNLELLSVE